MLNVVKSHILSDTNIQQQFPKCFSKDDDTNIINVLYHDCVNPYLAVSSNQFRKSLVHNMRSKKPSSTQSRHCEAKTTSGNESEAKKQKKDGQQLRHVRRALQQV